MDTLDKLLWIEEIRQLKSRYFRFMDTKDWGALRTVFCDDATFDCRTAMNLTGKGEGGRAAESNDWFYSGGDRIVDFIRTAVGTQHTAHHGHCHEIEVLSAEDARGVIAMEDKLWSEDFSVVTLHGYGHYHETYRRVGGEWRIHTSRITRLYVKPG